MELNLKFEKEKFYRNNHFYGFTKLSEEQMNRIIMRATFWNENYANTGSFIKLPILYKYLNDTFKDDEAYLFLIYAIDPEFKLLKIYFEESNMEIIKQRFLKEFGFYFDNKLLILERYYNKQFHIITDEFSVTK